MPLASVHSSHNPEFSLTTDQSAIFLFYYSKPFIWQWSMSLLSYIEYYGSTLSIRSLYSWKVCKFYQSLMKFNVDRFRVNFKRKFPSNVLYPENEKSQRSFACSASLHIYNAQTKGIQHKSMVKPALKVEGYTACSTHSIGSTVRFFTIWFFFSQKPCRGWGEEFTGADSEYPDREGEGLSGPVGGPRPQRSYHR